MKFALMQKALEMPDVESLRRALKGQAGLAAADAPKIAANATGILLKGLSSDAAFSLQKVLAAEGIQTAVVAESDLPTVPLPRAVKSLKCEPDSMVLRDALNRDFRVPWSSINYLAAGLARMSEFTRIRQETGPKKKSDESGANAAVTIGVAVTFAMLTGVVIIPKSKSSSTSNYFSVEDSSHQPIISILTSDAVGHYCLEGDNVRNALRGRESTGDFADDFPGLVRELCHYAPQAKASRGVTAMVNEGACLSYPNKGAFQHEIIWHFWREKEFSNHPPEASA